MPIKFDLKKYLTKNFIETGTYIGDGVRKAIDTGFKNIYSIELDTRRFNHNVKQFQNYQNVHIIHGNSGIELPKLLDKINEKSTFWIDAHFCGEEIGVGKGKAELADKWTPIKEELEAIKNHHIKDHILLIDDFRCMNNTHIDERTGKPAGFPGKDNLLKKIKEINSNYTIEFLDGVQKNDVVLAYIKE